MTQSAAAKRRKNAAHGISRGLEWNENQPQRGEREGPNRGCWGRREIKEESVSRVADKRREENATLKKIGAESSDPNRHSQPRLPGSVVGDASMRHALLPHKITKVSVPRLRDEGRSASKARS